MDRLFKHWGKVINYQCVLGIFTTQNKTSPEYIVAEFGMYNTMGCCIINLIIEWEPWNTIAAGIMYGYQSLYYWFHQTNMPSVYSFSNTCRARLVYLPWRRDI